MFFRKAMQELDTNDRGMYPKTLPPVGAVSIVIGRLCRKCTSKWYTVILAIYKALFIQHELTQ